MCAWDPPTITVLFDKEKSQLKDVLRMHTAPSQQIDSAGLTPFSSVRDSFDV